MGKKAVNALIAAIVKRFPRAAFVEFVNFDKHIDDAVKHVVHLAQYLDAERTRQIQSTQDALADLTLQFTRILAEFEQANPASVLAGGLADFPLASRLADGQSASSDGRENTA